MTYETLRDARESLPANATWSKSFGNAGEGGYVEYYRTDTGERYTIFVVAPGTWAIEATNA